jgi:hypothetical protein
MVASLDAVLSARRRRRDNDRRAIETERVPAL